MSTLDRMVEAAAKEWEKRSPGDDVSIPSRESFQRLLRAALKVAGDWECWDILAERGPRPTKARVILFKASGKYYTQEEWEIPIAVKDYSERRGAFTREAIGPYDMRHSKDFRRIDGGAVLVPTQEPWGYPHLFPGKVES
jgi:hypothetical protein